MCIIYVCEQKPSKSILLRGQQANPHGMGIAYIENGKLKIKKGLWPTLDPIVSLFELINPPYIIHFRLRSAGAIGVEQCHPFYIGSEIALAHNGHILRAQSTDDTSDTQQLVKILNKIKPKTLTLLSELLTLIGGGKYALMDSSANLQMIGDFEKVKKGIYASNSGWRHHSYFTDYDLDRWNWRFTHSRWPYHEFPHSPDPSNSPSNNPLV